VRKSVECCHVSQRRCGTVLCSTLPV
jgi:hypothetical protein